MKKKLSIVALSVVSLLSSFTFASSAPNQDSEGYLPMHEVEQFVTALAIVKHYYVKPVDDKELFNDAIKGMIAKLDPHSEYLTNDDGAHPTIKGYRVIADELAKFIKKKNYTGNSTLLP